MFSLKNKVQATRIAELEQQLVEKEMELETARSELMTARSELEEASRNAQGEEQLDQLMAFENEHLKSSLMDIQGNLAQSVHSAKGTLENAGQLNEIFSGVLTSVSKMDSDLASLSSTTEQSSQSVNEMSSRAEEISSVLSLIKSIAEQTNLLALNAAIEAARAGEFGRGFAVVADEVRNLADKTQTAIVETHDVIQAMQGNVESVTASSAGVAEKVNSVAVDVGSFQEQLGNTRDSVDDYLRNIADMANSVFMSLAKLDHVIWKVNTYLSINMREPAFQFVDHHNCRLGKWYYEGEGQTFFSHCRHYGQLEAPHSTVHDGTRKIFDQIGQLPRDYADLMAAVQIMETASRQVFQLLDDILEENCSTVAK